MLIHSSTWPRIYEQAWHMDTRIVPRQTLVPFVTIATIRNTSSREHCCSGSGPIAAVALRIKCSLVDLSTSVSVSPPPPPPPLCRGLGGFGWCARGGFVQQERSTESRLRRQAAGNGEDVSCDEADGFPSPHNPCVFMGVVVHYEHGKIS